MQTSTLILPTCNSKLYCKDPTVVISFVIVYVTYRPMSHCTALNRLINRVIEIEHWGCVCLSVWLSGRKSGQICKQRKSRVTRVGERSCASKAKLTIQQKANTLLSPTVNHSYRHNKINKPEANIFNGYQKLQRRAFESC